VNLVGNEQSERSRSRIESELPNHQQFLRFQIQPNLTAIIEIDAQTQDRHQRVIELINLQLDRVVPMPHLSPSVMGVYNWRGEILWIVDLATLLLGNAKLRQSYRTLQPTMILNIGTNSHARSTSGIEERQEKTIGLVVHEIAEIEWYERDLICTTIPENVDPELAKWARGLWVSATGKNFLVLDWQKIISCADFHADV
jgi:positive phototaxis protein PixI